MSQPNIDRHRAPIVGAVILIALAGCAEEGPDWSLHDTKYAFVGSGGETVTLAEQAACVLDQYTGLTWELKTRDGGLRDAAHTYSWYNPDEKADPDGLDYRGTANGGECAGVACDTWSLVQAVKQAGLCGHQDWRIPQRDELGTISDGRKVENPPTANLAFFVDMKDDEYWSANDYSFQWDAAWVWNFHYGHDRVEWKKTPRLVRLVRGERFDPRQAGQ